MTDVGLTAPELHSFYKLNPEKEIANLLRITYATKSALLITPKSILFLI